MSTRASQEFFSGKLVQESVLQFEVSGSIELSSDGQWIGLFVQSPNLVVTHGQWTLQIGGEAQNVRLGPTLRFGEQTAVCFRSCQ